TSSLIRNLVSTCFAFRAADLSARWARWQVQHRGPGYFASRRRFPQSLQTLFPPGEDEPLPGEERRVVGRDERDDDRDAIHRLIVQRNAEQGPNDVLDGRVIRG